MRSYLSLFVFALGVTFLLSACSEDPVPKPKSYFRIAFPEKKYHSVDSLNCFSFDLPDYGFVRQSPDMRAGDRCWYNVYFPRFYGEVYMTYKDISKSAPLNVLLEDLHKTAYSHTTMAEGITAKTFEDRENRKFGIVYEVKGNVASQIQFCITDSTSRFIRGSLYFACPPNKDSLAPVVKFVSADVERMISSFRWK